MTNLETQSLKRLHEIFDHLNGEIAFSSGECLEYERLSAESSEKDRRKICPVCSPDSW